MNSSMDSLPKDDAILWDQFCRSMSLCFSLDVSGKDGNYDDDDERREEKGSMLLDSCFWERELSVKS